MVGTEGNDVKRQHYHDEINITLVNVKCTLEPTFIEWMRGTTAGMNVHCWGLNKERAYIIGAVHDVFTHSIYKVLFWFNGQQLGNVN